MTPETNTPPTPTPRVRAPHVLLTAAAVLLCSAFFIVENSNPAEQAALPSATENLATPSTAQYVDVRARAAFMFDATTGDILFEKNARVQLPLASLTKLMLALVVAEELPRDSVVVISDSAIARDGVSGFSVGDLWHTGDLLDFTLMTSSNDGAAALAETIGSAETLHAMNERAHTLGMEQTYFLNATGLDEDDMVLSGAYGSARDVARLLAYLLATQSGVTDATVWDSHTFYDMQGTAFLSENTNKALHNIPGLIAGKTGYTDLAGGNLAVAFEIEPGHTIVAVVLGSTIEGRFTDIANLVEMVVQKTAL